MNFCLCCQKNVDSISRYHPNCLKKLFHISWAPEIPFTAQDLPQAVSRLGAKMSISGVQMKVSIKLNAETKKIEIVQEGGTHILKPEPTFPELPQNENCCMNMAETFQLEVPPHGLFPMKDGKLCYIIKRFDRLDSGEKIHNESMAQILGVLSEDKYKSSLENVGKAIQLYATNMGLDIIQFLERVLFCFLTGNGDMHLKNWALITTLDKEIKLAPCYDFVCSNIYISDEDSALTINGKRNNLKIEDFTGLAKYLFIDTKVAVKIVEKALKMKTVFLEMIQNSELSTPRKALFTQVLHQRYQQIYLEKNS